MFQLCYHQHGGSGLGFTYEGVQQMPLSDLQWYLERLERQRSSEAEQIRRGAPKLKSA